MIIYVKAAIQFGRLKFDIWIFIIYLTQCYLFSVYNIDEWPKCGVQMVMFERPASIETCRCK